MRSGLRSLRPVMGWGSVRRGVLVGVIGAIVSACGQQPAASTPIAGLEASRGASQSAQEAPAAVPAGWVAMEDDTGALRLALPLDLIRIEGFPGVSAQLATHPPTFAIEIHAAAARELQPPRPWTKSAVETWLVQQAGDWTGGDLTDVETSVVQLPAGEAIQLRAKLRPGNPDAIDVLAYAIPHANGVADLHLLALPEYWETRGNDLTLIPQLLELDN